MDHLYRDGKRMNGEGHDAVVIGNIGIDTNVYLHGNDIDWTVEANFTENVDYVGQAGGYASRGYRALGKRTAFIGHVGEDHQGRFIRETLERDGIDSRGLFIDPAGTSRSINLMYRDGRRKNFYDGKSHMTITPDEAVCRDLFDGAKLAHFNIPNWARRLLPLARARGVAVACDIQDIVTIDDPYRRDFIEQADILFFSAVNHEDPGPLIRRFIGRNPALIIVSGMGARGCALGSNGGVRYFPPVNLDRPVIDANGAGDGLAVGFLTSYLLDGYPVEDAILRGQIAARHACSIRASTDHLIDRETLDRLYRDMKRGY